METIIIIAVVVAAAAFGGWRLWKALSGKGGCCAGCKGCSHSKTPDCTE